MKKVLSVFALVIAFATWTPTRAQTGITGTWQAESTPPGKSLTLVLRADGPRLNGVALGCDVPPVYISEGHIDGNTIKFKCKSLNGDREITIMGTINGDELALKWELQVRDGGIPTFVDNAMFGSSASPQFIAKRVPDAANTALVQLADQVRGVEFAAAVNLLQRDVKVEGTLFLPQRVSHVRSVIVVIDYGIGQEVYKDSQVKRLLEVTESGLLLAKISRIATAANTGVAGNPGTEGADGLLLLLQALAVESGHKEVKEAPLLLWGHSAAGRVGLVFATTHPDRTIAFVRYHSASFAGEGEEKKFLSQLPILRQIPVLTFSAGQDARDVKSNEAFWMKGRITSEPWAYAVDPDAEHTTGLEKVDALLIPWISAVLRQRLPANGTTLRPISDGPAWLGNNKTGDVATYRTYTGSKSEASWLPDEPSAQGWRVVLGLAK